MAKSNYSYQSVKQFCIEAFRAIGVPNDEAELVSDSLVWANLRGIDSHGVFRIPIYIDRIKNGLVRPVAKFMVVNETKIAVVIDAGNSLGQVIACKAIKICIEKAQQHGIGIAVIRNTNHFGAASYFTSKIAAENYIGVALSNAPPAIAPWGGCKALLGTNPISVAIPAGKYGMVVLDMATSNVARGKIRIAAAQGQSIPPDWAFDSDGQVTTDPHRALKGTLFPLGGPKGYGLALMVDIFSGVLSGAAYADLITPMYLEEPIEEKRNIGNFLCALDPGIFLPQQEFIKRMEDLCFRIKESPLAEGKEKIYLPGEIEQEKMEKYMREGIPLEETLVSKLITIASQLGVTTIPVKIFK
ncbi:Malate/L-lactate dehydrogenase [Moorella glycerini]|uniref:Oxidoreductase YjmC n=1 Tax=Neomoorella stamsii TaxID=1266720 RepID=A0A9X7J4Z0_9FIRM|nr:MULTISPECIES: Ldh family oxidoreductase [Moorella]PRR76415.1 putative oxidoreductase YjmC [Moorella stamsii]CEP67016.1 Malate/L-lactate dehydrogenase [Moorella glycerini]